MKKFTFFTALLLLSIRAMFAQVGINADNSAPNSSAMLDVKSTTRGLLPPRLTHTQLNAIPNPSDGLIVFCTDCGASGTGAFFGYFGGAWNSLLTCLPPSASVAGIHTPSSTWIVWNWHPVATADGYKWNTTNNFSTAIDMIGDTSKIEAGLTCNTSYTRYVWAYNTCGISAPLILTQTTLGCNSCGQPITDSRDGKIYNTTLIGSQCWLAQNMNIGIKIPGNSSQTNNGVFEKYCYANVDSNCDIYGGLYQWGEMVQYLNGASNTTSWNPVPDGSVGGICPSGWHLPTRNEWDTLIVYLGDNAGSKLKEAGTSHWEPPNFGATNESGFTCLPAGMVSGGGYAAYFQWLHSYAELWTCTGSDTHNDWMKWLWSNMTAVSGSYRSKVDGLAVRCIKN